ncbi:hypothetical protein K523DRAFT_359171 [Schizophyllum commune Tattone D]|nr:hypothetical protein K523DRAFT_359171 [Schizophyllum commune Tattone D]
MRRELIRTALLRLACAYPAITPVFVDVDYGLPLAIAHAAPRSTPAPRCVPAPQPSKAL